MSTSSASPEPDDSQNPVGKFLLYTTEDGKSRVECRFENETIWLSQALMAELFETTPQNITLHLKSLVEDEEIDLKATCKDYLQVRHECSREVRSIKQQLKNLYEEKLKTESTIRKFRIVRTEDKRYDSGVWNFRTTASNGELNPLKTAA